MLESSREIRQELIRKKKVFTLLQRSEIIKLITSEWAENAPEASPIMQEQQKSEKRAQTKHTRQCLCVCEAFKMSFPGQMSKVTI